MSNLEKKFGNFNVTLDNDMPRDEGEGRRTGCWITKKISTREYTASLESLMDSGELESRDGLAVQVEQAVIDDIEAWALENGY